MSTAPPSQRPPQGAGGGVDRKTIYNHDWNAERRLSEEVRHLRASADDVPAWSGEHRAENLPPRHWRWRGLERWKFYAPSPGA